MLMRTLLPMIAAISLDRVRLNAQAFQGQGLMADRSGPYGCEDYFILPMALVLF
jgi:hypothetical protein